MRFLLPLFSWAALLGSALANPIVIVGDERPATMTSETVLVAVEPNVSTVVGTYKFRQEEDVWPKEKDTHVQVLVPVLLRESSESYLKAYGAPFVMVRERKFRCEPWDDTALPALPKGWSMRSFAAKIPLHLIAKNFSITVKYAQPNLPGKLAAYIPLLPPKEKARGLVTFWSATPNYSLRPPGFFSMFTPKRPDLWYAPKDRQLLTAQLVKD